MAAQIRNCSPPRHRLGWQWLPFVLLGAGLMGLAVPAMLLAGRAVAPTDGCRSDLARRGCPAGLAAA